MSFKLRFWGVRGSYPAAGKDFLIGGNTTCLEVEVGGRTLIFDAGTGIIRLGKDIMKRAAQNKSALNLSLIFTHYHQDHTQGMPFFAPIYIPNSQIFFLGPKLGGKDLFDNLKVNMYMPFFPVNFDETGSHKNYYTIEEYKAVIYTPYEDTEPTVVEKHLELEKGDEPDLIKVFVYKNYIHPKDGSFYYRIEYKGKKVVFATDVEGFVGGDQRLIKASQGVDYLIHDCQYLPEVYLSKNFSAQGYGHATPNIAADVAIQAGVKNLILTHHDPNNNDEKVKKVYEMTKELFENTIYSYEVMEVDVLDGTISEYTGL